MKIGHSSFNSIIMSKLAGTLIKIFFVIIVFLLLGRETFSQYRPSLFFREDFKETPAAYPITQDHIANPDLLMGIYGPGCDSIKKSHHEKPIDDPYYVWSGLCQGNWAFTLRHKKAFADLSSFAKIRWRSEQAGLRNLYIILKLSNGQWLISDQVAGPSKDWRIFEFNIAEINWRTLDIKKVIEGKAVPNPDLSRVDEIGFTDLMTGGGSLACSRLDWIEVDANAVKR